jgi:hypothetical protein
MVRVQLRYSGEGLWRPMTLPTSVDVAQTLARAAKTLQIADDVQISPIRSVAKPRLLDIRV